MKFVLIFAFFVSSAQVAQAQDERYFRHLFTGELAPSEHHKDKTYKWEVETPLYQIDLDGDGAAEGIKIQKKDGEDWIELHGKTGKPFWRGKLQAKGTESYLFKIHLVSLATKIKALILHFYEGKTDYKEFNGSARIYLIVFEDNKLDKLFYQIGPSFWIEREKMSDQYFKREYKVTAEDFNNDGIKEIAVKYKNSSKVLMYLGNGVWKLP